MTASDDYRAKPATKGGKVISVDEMRDLPVHRAELADKVWRERLRETDAGPVLLMSGGPGSGKTDWLSGEDLSKYRAVWDGTLANLGDAVKRIEGALEAGSTVEVVHVTESADRAARRRAEIPADRLASLHAEARQTLGKLKSKYSSDSRVRFRSVSPGSNVPQRRIRALYETERGENDG